MIPLHQLEAARRGLPDLFDPDRGCCLADLTGETCGFHETGDDLASYVHPEDDPSYRVIEAVLDEAIARAQARPVDTVEVFTYERERPVRTIEVPES